MPRPDPARPERPHAVSALGGHRPTTPPDDPEARLIELDEGDERWVYGTVDRGAAFDREAAAGRERVGGRYARVTPDDFRPRLPDPPGRFWLWHDNAPDPSAGWFRITPANHTPQAGGLQFRTTGLVTAAGGGTGRVADYAREVGLGTLWSWDVVPMALTPAAVWEWAFEMRTLATAAAGRPPRLRIQPGRPPARSAIEACRTLAGTLGLPSFAACAGPFPSDPADQGGEVLAHTTAMLVHGKMEADAVILTAPAAAETLTPDATGAKNPQKSARGFDPGDEADRLKISVYSFIGSRHRKGVTDHAALLEAAEKNQDIVGALLEYNRLANARGWKPKTLGLPLIRAAVGWYKRNR